MRLHKSEPKANVFELYLETNTQKTQIPMNRVNFQWTNCPLNVI